MTATDRPATPATPAERAARDDTYTRLVEISRAACAEQAYELAYHALAAAFHRAVDLGTPDLVEQVSQEAAVQRDQVHLPPSAEPRASSLAVAESTMSTLYSALAQMAQTRAESVRRRQPSVPLPAVERGV